MEGSIAQGRQRDKRTPHLFILRSMKLRLLKPCVVYLGGELMACYGNKCSFPMAITITILRQQNPLSGKFQHAIYICNCTYP